MTHARQHSHHDSRVYTWPRHLLVLAAASVPLLIWLLIWLRETGSGRIYATAGLVIVALAWPWVLQPRARRSAQRLALTSVGALLWALPAPFWLPLYWWPLLLLAAFLVLLTAGLLSLLRQRPVKGIPGPRVTPGLVLQVAMDELVLGYFVSTLAIPRGQRLLRIARESHAAHDYLQARGWLDDPRGFHAEPPLPREVSISPQHAQGIDYELVRWTSGYQPQAGLPGTERWLSHAPLHTAHVRLFRHAGPPRPWLVGIHGYRMGFAWADFRLFDPAWLHHELGFNVALPVLPLHGARKIGWRTGDGFLDGDLLDTINALAQAQWDIRALLKWLRESQRAPSISVLGYSLGGYNAALLAGLDAQLDTVVAAIPLVDVATVMWENGPPAMLQRMQAQGLGQHELRRILRVVSPLAMEPLVPHDRRFIIGGRADRIVPLPPIMDLWRHWKKSRIDWFNGTHLSIRRDEAVPGLLAGYLCTQGIGALDEAGRD